MAPEELLTGLMKTELYKFKKLEMSIIGIKFLVCMEYNSIISITLLNNIFLGVQSLYRRCPNLQGMETRLSR